MTNPATEIASRIIRDCCEAEVAEFGSVNSISIHVDDLRAIVDRALAAPVQAVPATAWLDPVTLDVIHDSRKTAWLNNYGIGGVKKAVLYTVPLAPINEASPAAVAAQKAELRRAISTAPERIWLDCGGDDALDSDFGDLADVTWSRDNATGFGIEYVRALAVAPATTGAGTVTTGATAEPSDHLFELWWAEYMPESTQAEAWAAWTAAPDARVRRPPRETAAPATQEAPAEQPKPDPTNCTAKVTCDGGRITTRSCTTGKPLIDDGGSSDGERDYYICPDCGKNITIDYREN